MLYFLDFEASSLFKGSFPIEVAWVDENGHGESHLIRPQPGWTEWNPRSEDIHGIARAELERQGGDAAAVARRAHEVLHPGQDTVVSDNPPFDQYWLDMLLAVADCIPVPRLVKAVSVNVMEIRDLEQLAGDRETTPAHIYWDRMRRLHDLGEDIIGRAEEAHEKEHRHRALPDAMKLWRVWHDVRLGVRQELQKAAALATGTGTAVHDIS